MTPFPALHPAVPRLKKQTGMEDIISNVQSMEGLIDEIAKASREQEMVLPRLTAPWAR